MNLQPRIKEYHSSNEFLATSAGAIFGAVTLDKTKFNGVVIGGTAISVDPSTGMAKPWEDTDEGRALLVGRTVNIDGTSDIVTTVLEQGIALETKCTGVTEVFKQKAKLIDFK